MRVRLAVLPLVAIAIGGCGTEGSERDARGSVDRFFGALANHDGAAACRELSSEAVSKLEESEKKPCPAAVVGLGLSPARVAQVRVYLGSAEAKLTGGGAVFLDETSGTWKISAAGCKP